MYDRRADGRPRRTWSICWAVFLTTFLVGVGVSSAAALWSQSGDVQTTISTGTWPREP